MAVTTQQHRLRIGLFHGSFLGNKVRSKHNQLFKDHKQTKSKSKSSLRLLILWNIVLVSCIATKYLDSETNNKNNNKDNYNNNTNNSNNNINEPCFKNVVFSCDTNAQVLKSSIIATKIMHCSVYVLIVFCLVSKSLNF